MSNLSDLLPAGASAKQLTFTDSGSGISSKAPVVVNSDGTISSISVSSAINGAQATFESGAVTSNTSAVYDSNSQKIVVVYRDNDTTYGTACVGTLTGGSTNTIAWATPVVFESADCSQFSLIYQSTDNQLVVIFSNQYSRLYAISGEVSGTSTNWSSGGSVQVLGSHGGLNNGAAFDPGSGKIICAWDRNDNSSGARTVPSLTITVSGTGTGSSLTMGPGHDIDTGGICRDIHIVVDTSVNSPVVFFTKQYDSYKGYAKVLTVSGSNLSSGSEVEVASGKQPLNTGGVYDPVADKIIVAFSDNANSSQGDSVLGTVSGTSITFTTPVGS
jgi:hypothetical protein